MPGFWLFVLRSIRCALCACLFWLPLAGSHAAEAPRITVEGATAELEGNILGHLRIDAESCQTSLVRLQRLSTQVERDVEEASNALGYYQSQYQTTFTRNDECWELLITIDPGEPVTLGSINVQIAGNEEAVNIFSPLVTESGLESGVQLNHGRYEQLKTQLSALAVDEGYFSARFNQAEIALDLVRLNADINLEFEPGERFRFGAINIQSKGLLSDQLIRSYIPFVPGDPYSSGQLASLRQSLNESEFFSQITVTPQLTRNSDNSVPVTLSLTERPRHAYSTGIGFTTDTGPRIRFNYDNRFLNTRGHTAGVESSLSAVRSQINANYAVPLKDAARQSLHFGAGFLHENNDSYVSDNSQLQTSIRTQTANDWQQIYSLQLQREDYQIGSENNVTFLSIPGFSLSKTEADNLINPSGGWRLFSEIKGASNAVLSDTSFIQLYASAKHVMSLGNFRFLSRVESGSTLIDETSDLPASLRYFTGGDQSVRGYNYQTLGPLNELGEVIGGKHMVAASFEVDYALRANWRAAFFVDTGNAFNDFGDVKLSRGAGLGVRWLSPIGPLRVDLAHPLDGDESFRLHITMGPDL